METTNTMQVLTRTTVYRW